MLSEPSGRDSGHTQRDAFQCARDSRSVAAALVAGCGGSVPKPKPNPAGDAALLGQLQDALCSKSCATGANQEFCRGGAAITAAATTDSATVLSVQQGLLALTRTISSASPLAPELTDLEELLLDSSRRYAGTVTAEQDLATVGGGAQQALRQLIDQRQGKLRRRHLRMARARAQSSARGSGRADKTRDCHLPALSAGAGTVDFSKSPITWEFALVCSGHAAARLGRGNRQTEAQR